MDDTAARLIKLEEQAAHQEAGLQQLSDVIADQWRTIDQLRDRIQRLQNRIAHIEEEADFGPPPPEAPPPHY